MGIFSYNKIIIRTVSARTSSKVYFFSLCFSVGRRKRILIITLSVLLAIGVIMIVLLTHRVVIRRRIIIQQTIVELKIEGSKQAEGALCEKNPQHPILVPRDSALV